MAGKTASLQTKGFIVAEYEVLTDSRPDGSLVGLTAAKKVGFFGTTPVVQQAVTAITATSSTVVTSVSVAVTEIQTALNNLGLTT